MPLPHLCGLDEVLQLDSRRPAMEHLPEILGWVFDPNVEPGVRVVRGVSVAVSFAVGFVLGDWETTWSSTQAEWGVQKMVHQASGWATGSVGTAVLTATSVATGFLAGPTLSAAISGSEWIGKRVRNLTEARMKRLYPFVVAEWSLEYFGTLGASIRVFFSVTWARVPWESRKNTR